MILISDSNALSRIARAIINIIELKIRALTSVRM